MNWFVTKVKYAKLDEQGLMKAVNEQYVVRAYTVTEAEANITKILEPDIRGADFDVYSAAKSPIFDVFFYDDSDFWYNFKTQYVIVDSDTGKEKKVTQQHLIAANDVRQAEERIREEMSQMTVTIEILAITKTKIENVFDTDSE